MTLSAEENSDDFMVGNIKISPQHNMMTIGEHTCRLQPKVMALLHYLAKNNDRVINNDELLEHVWQGRIVTNSSIQKCVNALRSAFAELDGSVEYVVYFSKRGYQLVTPIIEKSNAEAVSHNPWRSLFTQKSAFIVIATFIVLAASLVYHFSPFQPSLKLVPDNTDGTQFTQVKPYASNTGRERVIEPHPSSKRVAFVRDEFSVSVEDAKKESRLFIQGLNGQEWQVSIARGDFVALAWSLSGRNLVAIDVHNENKETKRADEQQEPVDYYTLHIYTLDFKGEKVIEKNILSHWQGKVSSVSWWGENVLEFTASQGEKHERTRYRYGIADQNLSMVKASIEQGKLQESHIFNKKTALRNLLDSGEQIQLLDARQNLTMERAIPFNIMSMSWICDETGLLLLSDDNQLSILHIDGSLHEIDYSPKVNGRIKQVRSRNKGRNIVLTVEAPSSKNKKPLYNVNNHTEVEREAGFSQEHFMEKGGGFIYSNKR